MSIIGALQSERDKLARELANINKAIQILGGKVVRRKLSREAIANIRKAQQLRRKNERAAARKKSAKKTGKVVQIGKAA